MGSPYLNTNEAILLSTHNVVINTIPAEAILTSQRLILVDSRHAQLRPQDIPFTALETVTIGDTSALNPVLSLSIVMKDDVRHTLGIVFPQVPKTRRTGERDEWAVKLKEASLNAQQGHGVQPAELMPPWVPGEIPEETDDGVKGEEIPDEKYFNPPLSPRKPHTGPKPKKRAIIAAGLVILLIVAGAAGVYFFAPSFTGTSITQTTPAVTPVATTPTEVPVTTVPPATVITQQTEAMPEITTVETPAQQTIIPQAGVWIRIEYAGNFTASFGTSGRLREITGSGDQLYQIPAKDEIVEATVEKLDDSGSLLTVSIYNDGQIVKSSTTQNPHGTVEIHTDLRVTSPTTASTTSITG
ncbi:MAG: hypothetical protein LUQ71_07810 [Methanoregula sp.]|nr:hypothetical protein [Methanoregula sp.]